MRPFGYHISGGQHLGTSLQVTAAAGFTAAQIFLGPPQRMEIAKLPRDQFDLFCRVKSETNIKVFVHAPYVLHAFAKPENIERNNGFLKRLVQLSVDLEADGFVLHMGGTKWYEANPTDYLEIARKLMSSIYPTGRQWCPILFENCANGNQMSGHLETITNLLDQLKADSHNVGLCLDTLHAWAWGYDLIRPSEFTRLIGDNVFRHLKLIHLNSGPEKVVCGGKYDRHAALHKGCIPLEVFTTLLRTLPDIPVIAEREDYQDVLAEFKYVTEVDAEPVYKEALS